MVSLNNSRISARAASAFSWFAQILSLVHRDYAVQFAGTALGLVWLFFQYAFQIAVYFLIFGFVMPAGLRAGGQANFDYLSFILGGMSFWLPVSDMLVRSCGILSDNSALIRRTGIGLSRFLWVPVFEGAIHYLLLTFFICLIGAWRGTLSIYAPIGIVFGLAAIFFLAGWAIIFARISVIVKDISPVVRLLLQIVFWATPIVYTAGSYAKIFALNPFYAIVSIHRGLLFGIPVEDFSCTNSLSIFLLASIPVFYLSSRRLKALVVDHL